MLNCYTLFNLLALLNRAPVIIATVGKSVSGRS